MNMQTGPNQGCFCNPHSDTSYLPVAPVRVGHSLFPIYKQKLIVAEQGRLIYIFKISLVTNIVHFSWIYGKSSAPVVLYWMRGTIQDFYLGPSLFTSQLSPFFPMPSQALWEVASSPSLKIFKSQLFWGLGNAVSLWRKAHFERCLDKRLPEVSQPEVFQVVNSIFRNTWCKPCTIPFSPKTCWQFCFCRNWKNTGFVQGCTVVKPRMCISQNLPRKSLMVMSQIVSPRATTSQLVWQSHEHSPDTADTAVLRNLLLPAALSGCSVNIYKH